jgi:hypothetical protein
MTGRGLLQRIDPPLQFADLVQLHERCDKPGHRVRPRRVQLASLHAVECRQYPLGQLGHIARHPPAGPNER